MLTKDQIFKHACKSVYEEFVPDLEDFIVAYYYYIREHKLNQPLTILEIDSIEELYEHCDWVYEAMVMYPCSHTLENFAKQQDYKSICDMDIDFDVENYEYLETIEDYVGTTYTENPDMIKAYCIIENLSNTTGLLYDALETTYAKIFRDLKKSSSSNYWINRTLNKIKNK